MDSSGNKDFNDILKQGLISAEFAKDNLKKVTRKIKIQKLDHPILWKPKNNKN